MLEKSISPTSFEHSNSREKGQSLLELAFAMIFLLVLLAGIVDLGRMLFTYLALRDAAETGAVFASFCPPTGQEGYQKVNAHIRASSQFPVDLTSPDIEIYSTFVVGTTGTVITIRVKQTHFKFIMPLIGAILGSNEIEFEGEASTYSLQDKCPE